MTDDFIRCLAAPDTDPERLMQGVAELVAATIGAKLFTMTTVDREQGVARRCYSSMPDAYPVSGTKPLIDDEWGRQVLGRHQMAVLNSFDDIAAHFSDAELIRSLGCESCLNVPVVVMGRVLGTLNLLHDAGHYTPDRVRLAEGLKLPGAIAFMAAIFGSPGDWPQDRGAGG